MIGSRPGTTHGVPPIPGAEFFIGGKIVRDLDDATRKALENKAVSLERSTEKILDLAGIRAFE